jgi:hypothetical protein
MGMAGPDIVLFVAGLLLFAGAGYALVAQGGLDGGTSATGTYSVLYPLGKVEVGKENVADFGSATKTFPVNLTNVSKMTISIVCADTVPGGTFNLQIGVDAPGGIEVDPKAGACGSKIDIDVPIADVPASGLATGADRDAAARSLGMDANATRAVGEWKVTVNGARGGALPGLPAGNPSGSIVLTAQQWTPELTPVSVK